jgi:hypothetical protein
MVEDNNLSIEDLLNDKVLTSKDSPALSLANVKRICATRRLKIK